LSGGFGLDGPAHRAGHLGGAGRLAVRLQARLRRLEQRLGRDTGCPACRHRQGRPELIECRELADGTVVLERPEPAPCAVCGTVPERIVRVILTVAEPSAGPVRVPAGESP
jgi:hypothetical protein